MKDKPHVIMIRTINKNNDKTYSTFIDCNNLVSATRVMLTFKPKRHHEIIDYMIEPVETLV